MIDGLNVGDTIIFKDVLEDIDDSEFVQEYRKYFGGSAVVTDICGNAFCVDNNSDLIFLEKDIREIIPQASEANIASWSRSIREII